MWWDLAGQGRAGPTASRQSRARCIRWRTRLDIQERLKKKNPVLRWRALSGAWEESPHIDCRGFFGYWGETPMMLGGSDPAFSIHKFFPRPCSWHNLLRDEYLSATTQFHVLVWCCGALNCRVI